MVYKKFKFGFEVAIDTDSCDIIHMQLLLAYIKCDVNTILKRYAFLSDALAISKLTDCFDVDKSIDNGLGGD